MKLSNSTQSILENAVRKALAAFPRSGQPTVSDIHILPKQDTGEILVFDDDDRTLASAVVEEWADCPSDHFMGDVERILRTVLTKLQGEGAMQAANLLEPYSFVLVDDDRETVAELLLVDDDTLLVSDELLKGLDQELDDFLKQLLSE
ncbi:MAG: hypothetical protein ACI36X_09345 [Bacteroidaceae bacterium]